MRVRGLRGARGIAMHAGLLRIADGSEGVRGRGIEHGILKRMACNIEHTQAHFAP